VDRGKENEGRDREVRRRAAEWGVLPVSGVRLPLRASAGRRHVAIAGADPSNAPEAVAAGDLELEALEEEPVEGAPR